MIGGLLTGIATSPWLRATLRYGAIVLAVLLFLLALRRSGERAGRLQELLTGSWAEKDGTKRPMRQSDIIVVAPYNAQVNALRDALPEGISVGTVDKFQGQEAPVCLVSMTASSAEETPRGMDFLFSLNRINVAVSRAKGLALVFGAPRLREAKCVTIEQMRLVNTLCALPVCTRNGRGKA